MMVQGGSPMQASNSTTVPSRIMFTRSRFLGYFIAIICIFFTFILLGIATYPTPYSMQADTISHLGRTELNPNGWFLFTIALWSTALGLIPFYFVLFKLFRAENKVLTAITVILYFLTSAGLCMAGTFQEASAFNKLHLYSAYIAFGGFFLASIFTWILMGTHIKINDLKDRKVLVLPFIIEICIMSTGATLFITALVLNNVGVVDYDGAPYGFYLGFPFTEWMLVLSIFADKVFMGTIISRFLEK